MNSGYAWKFWIYSKHQEFGRKKPIQGKAIFTTPGSKLNLDVFKNQNLRIVEATYAILKNQ